MKIVICTIPLRALPARFPPFGAMAVIQALRRAGHEATLYDIDGLRMPWVEVERYFSDARPPILGISAVVSTAYAYTKRLVAMVKRVSPDTRIILGGNLGASAEVLHRRAGVDYCVIGEGERTVVALVAALAGGEGGPALTERLRATAGLTFLDPGGDLVFTGYAPPIPVDQLLDLDYSILEESSQLTNFFIDPWTRPDFAADPRTSQPHRRGKKLAVAITSKGCVSRCTFCHRWDKGYRVFPIEKTIARLRQLQERYNVGFIQFADENFGSDRRHTEALIEALRPLDLLFDVSGVRCRTVDPGLLARLKSAGCVSIYYGMETGSEIMLRIMEKNASVQDNLNAVRWTHEAGLYTVYQMVLGMPGETEETISQTVEFLKLATEFLPEPPHPRISINYVQALPGTPIYEYARRIGLIGPTLLDEERYLELISDTNAGDECKFLNFTGTDYLTLQNWRRRIYYECSVHYWSRRGAAAPSPREILRHLLVRRLMPKTYETLRQDARARSTADPRSWAHFERRSTIIYDVIAAYLHPLRHCVLFFWTALADIRLLGPVRVLRHLIATAARLASGSDGSRRYDRPLREILRALPADTRTPSERAMAPLREGR